MRRAYSLSWLVTLVHCLPIMALLLLATSAHAQRPGENIYETMTRLNRQRTTEAPPLTDWVDGQQLTFIYDKPNPLQSQAIYLALPDKSLIGTYLPADTVYLFNLAGDSSLSYATQVFLLPAWVVKRHTIADSNDRAILSLLDAMYQKLLQSNDVQNSDSLAEAFERYKTDTTLRNRHIAVLFYNYQLLIRKTRTEKMESDPRVAVSLLQQLEEACTQLYGQAPALVHVYLCEAMAAGHLPSMAREQLKKALPLYPESVALQVYDYKLEQDTRAQNKKLKHLKKKYPDHWLVRAIAE